MLQRINSSCQLYRTVFDCSGVLAYMPVAGFSAAGAAHMVKDCCQQCLIALFWADPASKPLQQGRNASLWLDTVKLQVFRSFQAKRNCQREGALVRQAVWSLHTDTHPDWHCGCLQRISVLRCWPRIHPTKHSPPVHSVQAACSTGTSSFHDRPSSHM